MIFFFPEATEVGTDPGILVSVSGLPCREGIRLYTQSFKLHLVFTKNNIVGKNESAH